MTLACGLAFSPPNAWGQVAGAGISQDDADDSADAEESIPGFRGRYERSDVFLEALRGRAEGTVEQLAESIRLAVRLNLIDDANRFLESIETRQMTDLQRSRMVEIITADELLRLVTRPVYSQLAKRQVAALLASYDRVDGRLDGLRERARGGHLELAGAIRDALRGNLDVEANRFLGSIRERNLIDDQRASMADIISAELLQRVTEDAGYDEVAIKETSDLLTAQLRRDQTDVYLQELRRLARGNAAQSARAIGGALRIGRHDQVSRFLELLSGRELTDQQQAGMVDAISAERLLRVIVGEGFSDAARLEAAELLAAKRRIDSSAERIEAAIGAVGSGDFDRESPAMQRLLAAGTAAIGPLAAAVVEESDSDRREALLRALAMLGEDTLGAMAQLAIYGSDAIRPAAIAALDRLRSSAAVAHLAVALHSPAATEEERSLATRLLRGRFDGLPTADEVERYLLQRLAQQREATGLADPDASAVSWSLDLDSGRPIPVSTTAVLAARGDVADTTRLLHRLGGLSAPAIRTALAADLAYRYELDPLNVIEQADELRQLWGADALDAESLAVVIDLTLREDNLTAAIAAMSLVDESTGGDTAALMLTNSDLPSPLVRAVMHPVAQVRYEAAAAIGRLGFATPYPGSSRVANRWIEMASLTRQPIALIVDTRTQREAQIERLIASLGFQVEAVSSVAEAVGRVGAGGDIRMIIATTILPDRSILELIDAVRRQPLGERIPFFIHGPTDSSTLAAVQQPRWKTPVIHLELPASTVGWGSRLGPVLEQTGDRLHALSPLTPVQRDDFRRQAIGAIGRLAGSPETYHFYDFERLAAASLGAGQAAFGDPGKETFGDPRLALLSASEDAQAQATLVNLLLGGGAAAGGYDEVVGAISRSFQRHGVTLESGSTRQLVAAYRSLDAGPQRDAVGGVIRQIVDRFGIELTEEDDQ